VQFAELSEERTGKIVGATVLRKIPRVIIPLVMRIDLVRRSPERILMVHGNHLFSGECRRSAVEIAFIAVTGPVLQATFGTEDGQGGMDLRLPELPADLLQESLFIGMNLEGLLAPGIATGLLHGDSMTYCG